MSTSPTISTDEFQALEQRVLRAVDIVKREREARAAAEADITRLKAETATLEQQLTDAQTHATTLEDDLKSQKEHIANQEAAHADAKRSSEAELAALHNERADVRQRIERLLGQTDDLL